MKVKDGIEMLVSLMANFRAITMRNNAAFGMMQTSNAMLGAMRNANPYNINFQALHQQDTFNALNMANYQLQYQVASAMEKQSKAMLKQESENKGLNFLA